MAKNRRGRGPQNSDEDELPKAKLSWAEMDDSDTEEDHDYEEEYDYQGNKFLDSDDEDW
jgi:hypothetical protein